MVRGRLARGLVGSAGVSAHRLGEEDEELAFAVVVSARALRRAPLLALDQRGPALLPLVVEPQQAVMEVEPQQIGFIVVAHVANAIQRVKLAERPGVSGFIVYDQSKRIGFENNKSFLNR